MSKLMYSVIQDFESFINNNGGMYRYWYCGITEDPRRRVFNEHRVEKGKNAYKWVTTNSSTCARSIEKYFLERGCQGGDGGGNQKARVIYVYKIGSNTKQ